MAKHTTKEHHDGHGHGHGGSGDGHHHDDGPPGFGAWLGTLLVLALATTVVVVSAATLNPRPRMGIPDGNAGDLLLLIVLAPLVGALFNGLLGRWLPRMVANTVGCASIGTSLVLSALAVSSLYQVDDHRIVLRVYSFLGNATRAFEVPMELVLDPLSAVMILIITGVGLLIHVYSTGYMAHDPGYARFFAYLNLFCASMLLLVLGSNLIITFIGWEGVGVCSYLLIGFWYGEDANATAGKKAFIVNRVGDFAFILGLVLIYGATHELSYKAITAIAADPSNAFHAPLVAVATLATLLIFIGCTGKSAQIPLYVWLPDAMAGPTPVSALIHAATMVTAGIYLIVRMNTVFVLAPVTMTVIMVVGAATALLAATIACTQVGIKKVLAYSTVSQLGFMFMAVGAGAFTAGIFHLMTHAFFKALLFLGAGAVMHGMSDEEDITKMGGLQTKMPVVHATFLVGCLAIAGVPGLSGFFSKDEILFGVLALSHTATPLPMVHLAVWVVGVLTAGLTAFYMFRLYFLTFWGECRASEEVQSHIHKAPASMAFPLMVLALLAAVGGYVGIPEVLRFGAIESVGTLLHHWLEPVLVASGQAVAWGPWFVDEGPRHMAEWGAMSVSVVLALGGIGLAYVVYVQRKQLPMSHDAFVHLTNQPWSEAASSEGLKGLALVRYRAWQIVTGEGVPTKTDGLSLAEQGVAYARWLAVAALGESMLSKALEMEEPPEIETKATTVPLPVRVVRRKYYVDVLVNLLFVVPAVLTGRVLHVLVDVLLIDTVLVNGLSWLVESVGAVGRRLQSGNVQRYAAYMMLGLGVILLLMFFR
ncbi:MAG: NADH-quinone oxidoreductase subunit L [Myxococcota bacterium]